MSVLFRSSRPVLATLFTFGLLAGAQAQNAVTLDNLTIPGDDGAAMTIGRVEFSDTNLTKDEASRLFFKDAEKADLYALLAKMTARRVTIQDAAIKGKNGQISFQPVQIDDVRDGRFARLTVAGFSGEATNEKGGTGRLASKGLELANGDFAAVLASARQGKADSGLALIESIRWDGFNLTYKDPALPAEGGEGAFSIGSFMASMKLECASTCDGAADATDVRVTLPPASEPAKQLKKFGFDSLNFALHARSRYDAQARRLVLEKNEVTEATAGALSLSGTLENVDAAALRPADAQARLIALSNAAISELKFDFDNKRLVDALLAYSADARGATPEALRTQLSASAAQLLPLLLGGDPSSLELAQSVQTFLKDPKRFSLRLKARGAPVPVARLSAIRDPGSFLALVDVQLVVNQ